MENYILYMQIGKECEIWDDESALLQSDLTTETIAPKESGAFKTVTLIVNLVLSLQIITLLSDSATEAILLSVKVIMETLNFVMKSSVLSKIISDYPTAIYKARKILGVQRDGFEKLVICPSCDKSYSFENSQECIGGIFFRYFCSLVSPNNGRTNFFTILVVILDKRLETN